MSGGLRKVTWHSADSQPFLSSIHLMRLFSYRDYGSGEEAPGGSGHTPPTWRTTTSGDDKA